VCKCLCVGRCIVAGVRVCGVVREYFVCCVSCVQSRKCVSCVWFVLSSCVAMCCSVLQCVAMSCSVLQ